MIYSNNNIINFYNIKFHNWPYSSIIKKISNGGYLCAPAAFPLCEIRKEKKYFQSLKNSKINLFDSGYFCILIRIFKRIKVKKFSGYFFLLKFLNDKSLKKKKILFVDPTINDSKLNSILLAKKRFKNFFNYVAPIYNSKKSYQDKKLFDLIYFKFNLVILNFWTNPPLFIFNLLRLSLSCFFAFFVFKL